MFQQIAWYFFADSIMMASRKTNEVDYVGQEPEERSQGRDK